MLSEEGLFDTTFKLSTKAAFFPAQSVKVIIDSIRDYGDATQFANASAALLEKILNTEDFRNAVYGAEFSHTNGLSNQQIYDTIMAARERRFPTGRTGKDRVIELRLRTITLSDDGQHWIDSCNHGTIGKDGGRSGVATICSNWLKEQHHNNRRSYLAAHFIHEYMHILNFKHPDSLRSSVPYVIHNIVERIADEIPDDNSHCTSVGTPVRYTHIAEERMGFSCSGIQSARETDGFIEKDEKVFRHRRTTDNLRPWVVTKEGKLVQVDGRLKKI